MHQQNHSANALTSESKALNKAKYNSAKDSFPNRYIVRNKKSGKMVEIQAMSPYHAAALLGWRPRHLVLVHTLKEGTEAVEVPPVEVANPSGSVPSTEPLPPTGVM